MYSKFRWKFNNSGEVLFLDSERYSKNLTRSILHYTPVTEQVIFHNNNNRLILFTQWRWLWWPWRCCWWWSCRICSYLKLLSLSLSLCLTSLWLSLQDFGTLSCWAINEIGEQSVSCLFQVVLAGNNHYNVISCSCCSIFYIVTKSPLVNCHFMS